MRRICNNENNKYFVTDLKYSDVLPKYYKDIKRTRKAITNNYNNLSNEEIIKRYRKTTIISERNNLCELLTKKNLGFVLMVAKRFSTNINDLPDLINCGNIGLIRAIDKYDEKRSKFITCAAWWIQLELTNYVNHDKRFININTSQIPNKKIINKIRKNFIEEYDSEPPLNELMRRYNDLFNKNKTEYALEGITVKSLDAPTLSKNNDELPPLNSLIEDNSLDYANNMINNEHSKYLVNSILRKLAKNEQKVIELFYGLKSEPMSFEQIGNCMGLCENRIGQIYKNALLKLKELNVIRFY